MSNYIIIMDGIRFEWDKNKNIINRKNATISRPSDYKRLICLWSVIVTGFLIRLYALYQQEKQPRQKLNSIKIFWNEVIA